MCKTTREFQGIGEVTAEFCLNCKNGFMVVEKQCYKPIYATCKKCGTKHKIRYYKNGKVVVERAD